MHLQDSVHHLFWTGFLRAGKRQRFRFGDLRITSLLFTDDPVVLASSVGDLQITLRWFASEAVYLFGKKGGVLTLAQFKYLKVFFNK